MANNTSATFTERAARVVRSPIMAGVLMTGAIPLGWSIGSDQLIERPSAQAPAHIDGQLSKQTYLKLASEGERLHRLGKSLQHENTTITAAIENPDTSETELVNLRLRYEQIRAQSVDKSVALAKYHATLVGNPALSEQDVEKLYSQKLKGTAYDHFYKLEMPHRDECRVTLNYGNVDISGDNPADTAKRKQLKSCMAESAEATRGNARTITFMSIGAGGVAYLALGGFFAAAAGRSRRRAEKKVSTNYAASLKKLEELIKPKTP